MVKKVTTVKRKMLQNMLRELKSERVTVGYFADQGKHISGMNYPTLMYLQEVKGVRSEHGLVTRRVFELTLQLEKNQMLDVLTGKLQHAFNRMSDTKPALEAFGKKAQKSIQDNFGVVTGLTPKNAQATIDKKGFNAPLIETSDLKKHLTYRIRRKGK